MKPKKIKMENLTISYDRNFFLKEMEQKKGGKTTIIHIAKLCMHYIRNGKILFRKQRYEMLCNKKGKKKKMRREFMYTNLFVNKVRIIHTLFKNTHNSHTIGPTIHY